MAPRDWDDEEDSSEDNSPAPVVRKSKFDDEEDEEDVLDSWDAAEDSEVEREKAAKAEAAAKAVAAEAAKNKKTKSQRIEDLRNERIRQRQADEDDESEEEDEQERRERMRRMEKEADLKNASDLFGDFGNIGISNNRGAPKAITINEGDVNDPSQAVDLSAMKLFQPQTRDQFAKLRETLVPLVAGQNSSKAQYNIFVTDLVRALVKDLSSEQIKKVASGLTTLGNEKMKEEKAAEKGGKKTKAAKTKTTLNASRNVSQADTSAYDDGLDEDDFM